MIPGVSGNVSGGHHTMEGPLAFQTPASRDTLSPFIYRTHTTIAL